MDNVLMDKKVLNIDKSTWKLTKLGELLEDISQRVDNPSQSGYDRFVGLEHFVSGDIKIKNWGTTENLTSSTKAFKAGDILFARRNAYLRRASLVDFDGCCSGDAFVLRENHDKVVPGFLAFFMNSNAVWDFANENAAGTMSKRVKWRDLANYEFLLPPKDQQTQLAELLWAMDEAKVSNERVYQKIDTLKYSFMRSFFDGNWDIISSEFETNLGTPISLNMIASIVRGSSPRPAGSPLFYNGEFLPWVTVASVTRHNSMYLKAEHAVDFLTEEGAKRTRIIPPNTVILTNSGATLGVPKILSIKVGANDGIAAFLDLDESIEKEFLFYYLLDKVDYFRNVVAAGAGQPNLNTDRIGKMKLLLPLKSIQKKFLSRMASIEESLGCQEMAVNNSIKLQKSIINQIF